jgi:hypothetical protein
MSSNLICSAKGARLTPWPFWGLKAAARWPPTRDCPLPLISDWSAFDAGEMTVADQKLPDDYWRRVFKGAWDNTLRRVGWDSTKVILSVAALIGSWMLGVILAPATTTGALLVGIMILAPIIFVWGMVQAQADMFRDQMTKQSTSVEPTNYLANPKPDFDMWRHRENLSLLEAAQLWAEVRPSMSWGTRGNVKDTYAMLEGAIQKGDLAFEPEGSIHPSAWNTAVQMEKKNPRPATKLTRNGLKAFATKHGYDPEFLQDRKTDAL